MTNKILFIHNMQLQITILKLCVPFSGFYLTERLRNKISENLNYERSLSLSPASSG